MRSINTYLIIILLFSSCKGFDQFTFSSAEDVGIISDSGTAGEMDSRIDSDADSNVPDTKAGDSSEPDTSNGSLTDSSHNGTDAATDSSTDGSADECVDDRDCPEIETEPSDCATAECRNGECVYRANDSDGDEFITDDCEAVDSDISVITGADCDDSDEDINPDQWDGPEGDGHSNGCDDEMDNDCSGERDDGVLADGSTCICSPQQEVECSLTSTGLEVEFPELDDEGYPLGECRLGTKVCTEEGEWGPCDGTVAPTEEVCDNADNDCDGLTDNEASNQKSFWYDADGDLHGARWSSSVTACFAPTTAPEACSQAQTLCPSDAWVSSIIPLDDCDDTVATRYPGAPELCNREDDNCDRDGGIQEEEDFDNDGFTHEDYASCNGGFPKSDCYDKDSDVHPGQENRFDVGYCLNDNAQIWCFEELKCAKVNTCTDSIGQEWGPGSLDYNCNGYEEPFIPTIAEEITLSNACAAAAAPGCQSPAAPDYTISGATCGGISTHYRCTNNGGSCSYSQVFLMTACR